MRSPAARIALALLAQLVLWSAVPSFAHAGERPGGTVETKRLLDRDGWLAAGRNVTRVAVHSPGQYASEVLSVFKMRIGRFLPERFGFDRETLRPYLLGGRTLMRLPVGRTIGEDVPGGARAAALHIGGGAELRLRERMFLSMDVGEVLQPGAVNDRSYTTWRLGVLLDF